MSLLALALLAGLAFGVVSSAFAGARRTASSFDRLRAATRAYDHGVVIDAPGSEPDRPGRDRYDDATIRRIRQLPQIETSAGLVVYVAGLPDADWEFSLNAAADRVLGDRVERERVLRGRRPDPHHANEVAVNEAAVDQAHVDVGGVLHLGTLSPAQRLQLIAGDPHAFDHGTLGPQLRLRVVGVFRGATDVLGRPNPAIFASQAFDHTYRGRVAYSSRVMLVRRAPGATRQAFHAAVDRVTERSPLGVFDAQTEDKPARGTINTLSIGLVVFALVAGIASILAVNQAVARHVAATSADQSALSALGLTRVQRMLGVVGTIGPAAVVAALLAVLANVAASPLFPVGLARRIEPDPGMRLDPLVAGLTAIGVVIVFLLAALLAARGLTRGRTVRRLRQASGLSAALSSAGAGPVVTTGVRFAFDRRPPSLPVRSALVGVTAAVLVFAAAVTFSASLDRLEREPRRWGFGWDLMLDTTNTGAHRLTHELAANHELDGVSLLSESFTLAERANGIRAYGLDHVRGSVGYALRSGVQPVGPDQVVIGPETARKLHLAVGDSMRIASCPCTDGAVTTTMTPVRVVGTALFPEDDDGNFNDALGFSGSGFARHVGSSDNSRAAVQIAVGRRLGPVARDLGRQYPGQLSRYSYPSRPGEVQNLAELRPFPRILAGLAALLGLAALANLLVTTLQRRRRELATLRSMGFTPGQTRRCIVWQSVSVAGVALGVGIPLGVLAGSAVWHAAVHGIGVATDISRPLVSIAVFSLAALTLAIATSVPIGSRAAHLHPAGALRNE